MPHSTPPPLSEDRVVKPEKMTCQQPREERQVSAERVNTLFVALQQMLCEYDTTAAKQGWDVDMIRTQAPARVDTETAQSAARLFIVSPSLIGGVLNRSNTTNAESDDEEMPGLLDESVSDSDED